MKSGWSRRKVALMGLPAFALSGLSELFPGRLSAASAPIEDDWDVLVVGAGAAGFAAAIAAKEAGAKRVLLIEKAALAGGHMLVSSGMMNALDPEGQKRMGRTDSAEHFFRDTFEGGGGLGNPALIELMVKESPGILAWLKSIGVAFDPRIYEAYSGVFPRAHKTVRARSGLAYTERLLARARKLGVEIRYRTRAEALDLDGRIGVRGVEVLTADGRRETLRARSVVLATGGFGANLSMRSIWAPQIPIDLGTTYSPGRMNEDPATGDGIRMAEAAGGAVTGMEYVLAIPFWGGRMLDYPGAEIFLTNEGVRFTDETAAWDTVFSDLIATGSTEFWVVTDSRSVKGATFATKMQQGLAASAETLEGLADAMGVPLKRLERTFRLYNEAARSDSDPEFGRTRFLQDLSKPPYYFGRERFEVHYTCGGIAILPDARVKRGSEFSSEGIPGLYAAGETTGGIHGKFRLGGNGLLDAFVFGRIAGRNAARHALRAQS